MTGWRKYRKDPFVSRNLPSRIANWCIARLLTVQIHDTGCALKAYRADLIRRIPLYSDLHRFLPAMCTFASDRFAEVVVRHHPRRHGNSKYGLGRVGRVLLDVVTLKMLLSCARRPLHWFGGFSAVAFLLGVGIGIFSIVVARLEPSPNVVFPAVSVLFTFLGLQLLFAGVFAELVVCAMPEPSVAPLTTTLWKTKTVTDTMNWSEITWENRV